MLGTSTEARITEAGERFMAGELSAGELLDRAASALWDKGEDGTSMATEYRALPGGDGGEWAPEPAPRHLVPVAAPMRMPIKTKEVELDGEWAGWKLTVRRNAPLDVVIRLEDLKLDAKNLGALMDLLPEIIIRWNFVDENSEPLPLTPAGMRQLPLELFQAIMEAFGAIINEQVTVPKE